MAEERILPSLKARFLLDSSDLGRAQGEAGRAQAALANIGSGADQAQSKVSGLLTPMRALGDIASSLVGVKLLQTAGEGLDELREAATVGAQAEVALRNQGAAAVTTSEQMDDLAASLLQVSGTDDEAIKGAETLLLRFRNIGDSREVVERATRDALDWSVAMGTDVAGAAQALGRALEAPDKASRSLRAANIILTDSENEAIKSALAHGDQRAAQEVIFRRVEQAVGGAAEAFGNTLPGQEKKATEALKNAEAALVQGFAPAINLGATGVEFMAHTLEGLPAAAQVAIGGLVFVGGTVTSLIRPVSDLARLSEVLSARRAASAAAAVVDTGATTAEAAATSAASAATAGFATANQGAVVAVLSNAAAQGELAAASALTSGNTARAVAGLYAQTAAQEAAALAAEKAAAAQATSAATAFGAVGIALAAVAAVGIATGQFGDSLDDLAGGSTEALQAVHSGLDQLGKDLDNINASSTASISDFLAKLVAAGDAGQDYANALNRAGITTGELADVIARGQGAFVPWLQSLEESGRLSDVDRQKILLLTKEIADQAAATLNTAVARGKLTEAQVAAAEAEAGGTIAAGNAAAVLDRLKTSGLLTADAIAALGDEAGDTAGVDAQADAVEVLAGTTKRAAEQIDAAREAQRRLSDTLKAATDPFFAFADAADRQAESQVTVAEKERALTDAIAAHGRGSAEAAIAQRELEKANLDAVRAASDLTTAELGLEQSVREGSTSVDEARSVLEAWVDQGLITQGQADQISGRFQNLKSWADDLDGTNIRMALTLDAAEAEAKLKELLEATGQFAAAAREAANTPGQSASGPEPASSPNTGYNLPRRALGGPVAALQSYWVGDKYGMDRAELFVPDTSGTVVPTNPASLADQLAGALASVMGQSSGEQFDYHPTFNVTAPPASAVSELEVMARRDRIMLGRR